MFKTMGFLKSEEEYVQAVDVDPETGAIQIQDGDRLLWVHAHWLAAQTELAREMIASCEEGITQWFNFVKETRRDYSRSPIEISESP